MVLCQTKTSAWLLADVQLRNYSLTHWLLVRR